MDIRKVKKLIELLDESGIAEIEITEGEESVASAATHKTRRPLWRRPCRWPRLSLHLRRPQLQRLHRPPLRPSLRRMAS